ncbi:hypothetical protein YC2023_015512 [Brassica napus]
MKGASSSETLLEMMKQLNKVDVNIKQEEVDTGKPSLQRKTLVAPRKEKLVRRREGYSARPKKHTTRL